MQISWLEAFLADSHGGSKKIKPEKTYSEHFFLLMLGQLPKIPSSITAKTRTLENGSVIALTPKLRCSSIASKENWKSSFAIFLPSVRSITLLKVWIRMVFDVLVNICEPKELKGIRNQPWETCDTSSACSYFTARLFYQRWTIKNELPGATRPSIWTVWFKKQHDSLCLNDVYSGANLGFSGRAGRETWKFVQRAFSNKNLNDNFSLRLKIRSQNKKWQKRVLY